MDDFRDFDVARAPAGGAIDSGTPGVMVRPGNHVWRQIGMTGSEHDQCVLCGARTAGLGQDADEAALKPCERAIESRTFWNGVSELRAVRR